MKRHGGSELCQAQVKLEVIVEVVVKVRSRSCYQDWSSTSFAFGWAVGWVESKR